MITITKAFILGAIQGITEWFPVSSSGHIVLAHKLLNLESTIAFSVWLHIATLFVILIFFRKSLANIVKAICKWQIKTYEFKLGMFVILSYTATVIIVIILKSWFEKVFFNAVYTGIALILTGTLLFFSEKNIGSRNITGKSAVLIGIAQSFAFMPGISRSGVTISTALLLGIKKQDAFYFSFLIAIPAILVSGIFKFKELTVSNISIASLSVGFIISFVIGFVVLKLLKKIVMREKFHYFAYYCWFMGILTLIIYSIS